MFPFDSTRIKISRKSYCIHIHIYVMSVLTSFLYLTTWGSVYVILNVQEHHRSALIVTGISYCMHFLCCYFCVCYNYARCCIVRLLLCVLLFAVPFPYLMNRNDIVAMLTRITQFVTFEYMPVTVMVILAWCYWRHAWGTF